MSLLTCNGERERFTGRWRCSAQLPTAQMTEGLTLCSVGNITGLSDVLTPAHACQLQSASLATGCFLIRETEMQIFSSVGFLRGIPDDLRWQQCLWDGSQVRSSYCVFSYNHPDLSQLLHCCGGHRIMYLSFQIIISRFINEKKHYSAVSVSSFYFIPP
jgi:hypothetical protein